MSFFSNLFGNNKPQEVNIDSLNLKSSDPISIRANKILTVTGLNNHPNSTFMIDKIVNVLARYQELDSIDILTIKPLCVEPEEIKSKTKKVKEQVAEIAPPKPEKKTKRVYKRKLVK